MSKSVKDIITEIKASKDFGKGNTFMKIYNSLGHLPRKERIKETLRIWEKE